jgi:vitamin B12 transporter
MDHRQHHRYLAAFLTFLLFSFLFQTPAFSDRIIVIAPPLEEEAQDSVVEKAPTAFTEVIRPGPESPGLVDTRDALRMASSVDLSDYGGAPTSPVTLRGSNFQDTLLMLDGIPLNPVTGDMVDISRFALPGIHQIEIIKGSNSAAFGKSAMGGVINLVTKNPAPEDRFDFTASQGTYGYGLYNAQVSAHAGEFCILTNLTRIFADNDFTYTREDGTRARRENNDILNTTGLVKAVFSPGGWETSVMGNLIDFSSGSPGSEGSAGLLTPEDKVSTVQNTYLVETKKAFPSDQRLSLRAWVQSNRTHTESIFGNSITKLTSESMSASYTKKIGIVSLTPGAEYLFERMNSTDFGIHSRRTGSGTIGTTIDLDPLLMELSTRYDDSSSFGSRWTYHAGAVVSVVEELDLKANVGTGYREPSMGQLFAPSTFFTFIPNPDLEPERSFNWDIGPAVTFKSFGAGMDYFHTNYKDLIKMDFPGPLQFTYVNVEKARASGIEAYTWVEPVDMVRLSANYLLSRFKYESGAFAGNFVKQKPEQIFNIQMDLLPQIAGKNATVTAAYQFRKGSFADEANTLRTDNRDILNAGISLEVNKDTAISFMAYNLLNDTSPEFVDKTSFGTFFYPVAGRTYRFAANIGF